MQNNNDNVFMRLYAYYNKRFLFRAIDSIKKVINNIPKIRNSWIDEIK